jgi:hypothetical protein
MQILFSKPVTWPCNLAAVKCWEITAWPIVNFAFYVQGFSFLEYFSMISAREDYLDVHQHDLNCSGGSGLMVETVGGNQK